MGSWSACSRPSRAVRMPTAPAAVSAWPQRDLAAITDTWLPASRQTCGSEDACSQAGAHCRSRCKLVTHLPQPVSTMVHTVVRHGAEAT